MVWFQQLLLTILLSLIGQYTHAQSCNKADVAFLLDESSSIQPIPFTELKQFALDVIDGMNIKDGESHVAVMFFSDVARISFGFNKIQRVSLEDLKKQIMDKRQLGGSTQTYIGLDLMQRHIFSRSYGARQRDDIARICIVVTDGNSQLEKRTKVAAKKLRDKGKVHVFAIGVGNETQIRQRELQNIASNDASIFRVKDTSGLNKIKNAVSGAACKVLEEEEPEEEEYDEDWVPTEGPPEEYAEGNEETLEEKK